jgi:hypothetical protein
VAVLVYIYDAVSELGRVVPAVLLGGLDPEQVCEVLSEVARGEEVVDVGLAVPLVEELVYVAGEEGLHMVLLDEVQEPPPGWLVQVVVVAGFFGQVEVGRVVAEDVDPSVSVFKSASSQSLCSVSSLSPEFRARLLIKTKWTSP